MLKKTLLIFLVAFMALPLFGAGDKETPETSSSTPIKAIKNPDTFIYASYGSIDSLDPVKAYDNASGGIIQNIYQTLVYFDGPAVDKFVPVLAEEVPTVENGGITNGGKTYRFKIRKNVKFHSGNTLTPEGVKYSIMRSLVNDPDNGPVWMWYFPLFGTYSSRDGEGNIVASFDDFNKAIVVDGDDVVINLAKPFPPFLSLISGYWGAIVDKDFLIKNGGWDGTKATWKDFNAPAEGKEILHSIASGTGPYKLTRWENGVEVVLDRFEGYWGKKPAMKTAIYKVIDEWATRKLMLLQGDADAIQVDPLYYEEMDAEKGITAVKDLKELGFRCINFNLDIEAQDNPYIGSGALDGEGIPPDFFKDIDVRRGFLRAWDQKTYINDILNHAGIESATPHVSGLPYRNKDLKLPAFDLKKAEEHFRAAWGGKLWEKGFKMEFLFNSGNEVRESAVKLLAENIMSLNPKFKIEVRGLEWATYLQASRAETLPLFYLGWGADYPHPDNFMQTYMHSQGTYGSRVGYNNPHADELLEAGATELDPVKAEAIYMELQDIWMEDAIGIALHQPVSRHYFKDWVKGYYFHPMENPFNYWMFSKE